MKERLVELRDWYGMMEDIIEELEEQGYEVLESNDERIRAVNDETEIVVKLNVIYHNDKPSTIVIDGIKEVLI